jgi:hypothetical protein
MLGRLHRDETKNEMSAIALRRIPASLTTTERAIPSDCVLSGEGGMRPTNHPGVTPPALRIPQLARTPLPDQPAPSKKAAGLYSTKDQSDADRALKGNTRSDPSNGLMWYSLETTLVRLGGRQTPGGGTWIAKHDLTYIQKK